MSNQNQEQKNDLPKDNIPNELSEKDLEKVAGGTVTKRPPPLGGPIGTVG